MQNFGAWIRSYTYNKGMYVSQVKDEKIDEKGVYEMYYDFAEPVHKMVSHRILATNRGEKEEVLESIPSSRRSSSFSLLGSPISEKSCLTFPSFLW